MEAVSRSWDELAVNKRCVLCPRRCGIDRSAGIRGLCGETWELRIASASIHRGEEPPVTGNGGSGTIFISGCNLGCVFCQNHQISREALGRVVSPEEFTGICLNLQRLGAENINIVTGSHFAPALVLGIQNARNAGLRLPVLWNSSAYESAGGLSLLEDAVDVYLPDLKTLDTTLSRRFFNAPDYPEYAAAALERMMTVRKLRFKERGLSDSPVITGGVVIRHLVLPGHLESTEGVLRWFAEHAQGRALLSVMTQYTPVGTGGPRRFLNEREYETVLNWLDEFGIEEGFLQEPAADNNWLPDFKRENPFSSERSVPVWHWAQLT
ncbi:MAG: radical SAM protein [Treponema sp.]|jgi:putative pyruvate formate lyase activating enzyme|nr:radical SAM protein [Treponema sp.]